MRYTGNQSDNRIHAMEQVIRKLRNDDLNQGHCFMIFDDELAQDQAYYEYPNGGINIEQLNKDNLDIPRTIIRVLSPKEIKAVKEKHAVFH